MVKNIIKLQFLVILIFLAILAGCSNKDEVEALKEELAQTQEELKSCQRDFEAAAFDLRNLKAVHRDLVTQRDNADDASQTNEEQLILYEQKINELNAAITKLGDYITEQDNYIAEQDDYIAQLEASLAEYEGTTDQTTIIENQ